MGVANQKSIAWGIAEVLSAEGASLALSYQGENFKKRVSQLKKKSGSTPILATILVGDDPASATYVKMKG